MLPYTNSNVSQMHWTSLLYLLFIRFEYLQWKRCLWCSLFPHSHFHSLRQKMLWIFQPLIFNKHSMNTIWFCYFFLPLTLFAKNWKKKERIFCVHCVRSSLACTCCEQVREEGRNNSKTNECTNTHKRTNAHYDFIQFQFSW